MGDGGGQAEEERPPVLVSALRLTLGLATLPLLGFGLLVMRGERAFQLAQGTKPGGPSHSPAQDPAESGATDGLLGKADPAPHPEAAALPSRDAVDAALLALTTATLPRGGRPPWGRPSRRNTSAGPVGGS